jgi:DNA-binding LytR/AlgR family response regulator
LLKCIIVEDETLAQDVIRNHLARIGGLELVGVFRTAPEAVPLLSGGEVDILFLDIRLPGMSGLHFLRTLLDPPLVVLTTAYAEYALESYEFNVIDYLLKPISFERFSKAVNKILDGRLYPAAVVGQASTPDQPAVISGRGSVSGSVTDTPVAFSGAAGAPDQPAVPAGDHIFIKSNSKFFRVDFAEILYVQGMKDYLKIHTPDFTLITHQTMNDLEKLLPPRLFIRVHRSYLVAVRQIRSIYGNTIELGKVEIPIGVNYKDAVMELVGRK